MAGGAELIPPHVVDQDEDDVGLTRSATIMGATYGVGRDEYTLFAIFQAPSTFSSTK